MWRRRRKNAPRLSEQPETTGGGTADAGHHSDPAQRRSWRSFLAWRVDRSRSARVALTAPPEYARVSPGGGMAAAPVGHPTNGRLGDLMPSVYCTGCGEENPEGARFCSHCGTPLVQWQGERSAEVTSTISLGGSDLDGDVADEAAADSAMIAALPPGTALLAVRRGPNAGSRFLLDSDLTLVGRHPDSDIFLDDVTVSRRHAEFYRQGGTFTVRDVGSHNGTYVNRERIEEAELAVGDEVQVGKFRLVFLVGPRAHADPSGGGSQVRG
jgi:FHA domain/zinc-ribbon domain